MSRIELYIGTCSEESLGVFNSNMLTEKRSWITEERLEPYELIRRAESINARDMDIRSPCDDVGCLKKDI